jgi:hypothetical protein
VYKTSVAVAVASLKAAVRGAMEQAISRGYSCKSKFRPWFSNTRTLPYYIFKINYFHLRSSRNGQIDFTTNSLFTESLLQTLTNQTGLHG